MIFFLEWAKYFKDFQQQQQTPFVVVFVVENLDRFEFFVFFKALASLYAFTYMVCIYPLMCI